jgi:HlyD family secretion protein
VLNFTSELADVRRRAEVYRAGSGAVYTALDARQFADREAALASRLELAKRRVAVAQRGKREEIAAQQKQTDRRRDIADFRKQQIDAMHVRAGSDGIVQDLPLELGQWVAIGAVLARVIQPERLKAVLRIPELQAKDLQIGQSVSIDTRNGLIAGQVARIAPAANQGTVTVEVRLDGELPRGARPDLSIEGTIEIERLPDVLLIERPAGAQPEAVYNLFKFGEKDDFAIRTRVEFGRSSVGTIEVRAGLRQGEQVILSDMTRWDGIDRVKLH